MDRCHAVSFDGRRCLRPAHGSETRHLVARNGDYSTFVRVAEAWGYPTKLADSCARGALDGARQSGNRVTPDDFAEMCEGMQEAVGEAIERKNRERFGRGA